MSHRKAKQQRKLKENPIHSNPTISPEANLIIKERQRQVEEEGYDSDHDDNHVMGDLSVAAHGYYVAALTNNPAKPENWPWADKYWKPTNKDNVFDRKRCLVKAGALIFADIDRLNRMGFLIVNQLKKLSAEEKKSES